ncbi:hypothetical protein ONA91_28345 [Micromonospora sp. DR5-3]|uniref:hypothetical protein n=1 Tax=unclassified Micromonospora TaxID=2617518 RepID=UPI0011D7CBB4|nr:MULTISPECIES: hypothetical protein [unclassified Micromonospora]MCW3818367.1 hypothetical protein [Micromonospora sp. DR5-3]TYC22133.1 hypothetical protein FXF52_22605 [Micromonospora sp. MP36]
MFIDRYVNTDGPGDQRLSAFTRTYITGTPTDADASTLADLRWSDRDAFTLYLRSSEYSWAMITITDDDAAVLGLSLADPDNSPLARQKAEQLIYQLRREFAAPAGIAGVEMPPPGSRKEWQEDQVQLRVGTLDESPTTLEPPRC